MIYQFPTFPMRASEFDQSRLPGFKEIHEHWTAQALNVVSLDFRCLTTPPPQNNAAAQHFTLQAQYACIIENVSMAQWIAANVGPCTCSMAYSMGLFAAVAHAQAIEFPSALELARDVCVAAHQTATENTWAIGAAVDFPEARLRVLMQEASARLDVTDLYGANTVLFTGLKEPVTQVLDRALLEGASSTRLIPVTAPFHTTQLQVIEPSISKALDRMRVVAPRWPILSSITQEFLVTEDDVRAEICRNVSRPMNWFATLKAGLGRGEAGWVESGASFILTDLVRDLFPDAGQYRDFRDMQGHHD
jgi:malonyl CoA-acyl carrier protein transacylase